MASIIYQTNRKTGAKYAYSQESYWDKAKGQPRSRRTYLGRVDPETGEIIPKRKKEADAEPADVEGAVQDAVDVVNAEDEASEVERLRVRVAELEAALRRISAEALDAIGQ